MVRTQIQLTEAQAAEIKRRAARQGISMAEAIRRAVDREIAEARPELDDDMRRRAMEAVGFVRDVPDLSENHVKYLAEAYLS